MTLNIRKDHKTFCPECNEPVFRRGRAHDTQKMRYSHRKSQKLDCDWHGLDAVGADLDIKTGVDPKVSKELKSEVVASRGDRMTYVITSAQNATPVEPKMWETLLGYVKHNDARLLVIPFRYHNPTSHWGKEAQSHDWWHADVLPYLFSDRVDLNKNLTLLADIMTQPTASEPLEGFEAISGGKSAIVGHPRLEVNTIPTPQSKMPKILTTTGACTKKNYIDSKAGKKGEFHHTFGALVVEVDGGHFHMRQLNFMRDGTVCDLLWQYDGSKRTKYDRVAALVMGDTHVEVIDPSVVAATFMHQESIVNVLRPEKLVWHDVFDGASCNWHDRGRAFHEYAKYKAGKRNVEGELVRTLQFIDAVTPKDTENVIVASNHHDFLREWVENTDPRKDPENCVFWAETYKAMLTSENTRWTPSGVIVQDPFAYWGKKRLAVAGKTTFLNRDQSHRIAGIEVSYHGDRGPGGAVGSRQSFRKIGVKTVIGHGHAPGVKDGTYQVGTSSFLNLTYAAGSPSAWLHTHCVIYPNGKRSLINIIDGAWRAA
jgi:hypothetical protein